VRVSEQAESEDWLAAFYAGLSGRLRAQLFISPVELEPLLQLAPRPSSDAVVLFVANKRDERSGYIARDVVSSQSFVWWGATRQVAPFRSIDEVLECLLERRLDSDIQNAQQRRIHDLRVLHDFLERPESRLRGLWPITPERSVFVYVRRNPDEGDTRSDGLTAQFFKVLAPYLDLYRASTVQTLNDTYKVRGEELGHLVGEMTSSPLETARLCIERVICHARFGAPQCWLYEYRSVPPTGHAWQRVHGDDGPDGAAHAELLNRTEARRVFIANKVFGEILDSGQHVLLMPFRAPDVEYLPSAFEGELPEVGLDSHADDTTPPVRRSSVRYRISAQRTGSERLVPGDLVIAIVSRKPPHPNLLHTMASFRQLYFGVVLPRIKQAARNAVDESSKNLSRLHRDELDPARPDLWQSFARICEKALPTFSEALRISIGINIYDVGNASLKRIFYVDHPGASRDRTRTDMESLSLLGKQPGVVASTFLQRVTPRSRDYQVVDDVRNYAGYIRHRVTTASEYCCKLWFRSTPIGTINFESDCRHRFTVPIRRELDELRNSLEQYIERFLSRQDARWLSISATSYHHLHELRGASEGWPADYGDRVREAIASFDAPPMNGIATVGHLQDYLSGLLDEYLENTPGPGRQAARQQLARHCNFNVIGDDGAHKNLTMAMARFELLTRIVKNLSSNFFRDGMVSPRSLFAINLIHRPFVGIRLEQYQAGTQSAEWLRDAGYRPLIEPGTTDRTHHGLFLCGAIARFLDGFAWAGNREGDNARSVVSIVVPLQSQE